LPAPAPAPAAPFRFAPDVCVPTSTVPRCCLLFKRKSHHLLCVLCVSRRIIIWQTLSSRHRHPCDVRRRPPSFPRSEFRHIDQSGMIVAEYVWIDASGVTTRSKCRVLPDKKARAGTVRPGAASDAELAAGARIGALPQHSPVESSSRSTRPRTSPRGTLTARPLARPLVTTLRSSSSPRLSTGTPSAAATTFSSCVTAGCHLR